MTRGEVMEAFEYRTLQAYVIVEVLERLYADQPEAGVEYLRGYLDGSLLTTNRSSLIYAGKPTWFYDPEGRSQFVGGTIDDGLVTIPWRSERDMGRMVGYYAYDLQVGRAGRHD